MPLSHRQYWMRIRAIMVCVSGSACCVWSRLWTTVAGDIWDSLQACCHGMGSAAPHMSSLSYDSSHRYHHLKSKLAPAFSVADSGSLENNMASLSHTTYCIMKLTSLTRAASGFFNILSPGALFVWHTELREAFCINHSTQWYCSDRSLKHTQVRKIMFVGLNVEVIGES